MFNFHAVNTAEVNAGSLVPDAPVLSINATEDISILSWTSPYFTNFFTVYWSDEPFTSADEQGVHSITSGMPTPGATPAEEVTYGHTIPANFSLSVLYYRVVAFNSNGSSDLSNQVTNYNYRLAIYEEIYNKTLDDLLFRFTPEIRRQYEDSQLWRSFVQSLASEVAQSRFEIKEAVKQLNLQKAIDVFLNMWNSVIGISRNNVTDVDTGDLRPETDAEYRQRLVDNVFWDKISNLALKKTMLLRLGHDGTVLDAGVSNKEFMVIPEISPTKLKVNHGLKYFPGETIAFLYSGPNGSATCVSDDGSTLVYENYVGPNPPGRPDELIGQNTGLFNAIPTAAPRAGLIELISQGSFATSASLTNWTNKDSGAEGPPDTTVHTFRPSNATDINIGGNWFLAHSSGGSYAFDTDLNTYAEVAGTNLATGAYIFSGFPASGTSFTQQDLKVKIHTGVSGSFFYSTDLGANWSAPVVGGSYDGTVTIPLSASQDLTQIALYVYDNSSVADSEGFVFSWEPTLVYDIRVEGFGTPTYGVSSWSSEYGGSMKLMYGRAGREYQINTSSGIGQQHTLTFQNSNGLVYVRMGTASGDQDIFIDSVFTAGYTTILFVPTTAITYLRFYTKDYWISYIDNVSVIGPGPLTSGTLAHGPLYNVIGFWALPGADLEFISRDGLTKSYGKLVSNVAGVLTFEHVGTAVPHTDDYVRESASFGYPFELTVLLDEPTLVTSANSSNFTPKRLSNIYSVNLGVSTLSDSDLNDIYEEISPLAAIGNVLTEIIQDVGAVFEDWDTTLGNIPYGAIFMGHDPYTGSKDTESNWAIDEALYVDNQWTASAGKTFYGNDGPDDIVILTRKT